MRHLTSNLIGRLGNQLFQYAYARALAERRGVELRVGPWIGEQLFELSEARPDGSESLVPGSYRQNQSDLIYTRADCRRWFKLKPALLERIGYYQSPLVAHRRVGDYAGAGYPVISEKAIRAAVARYGFNPLEVGIVTEEDTTTDCTLAEFPSFTPDFLRLIGAKVLFRGNSTFSYWAAVLADEQQKVFAPVITGLTGGIEHDNVPFVEGNYPRFCELGSIVTDLYLPE